MRHRDASDLLPRFVGGELNADERAGLEVHLAECDDCRDWVETWNLLVAPSTESAAVEAAPHRPAHPTSDLLARSAVDRTAVSASDARLLDEHLAHCASCRGEMRLARAALTEAAQPESTDRGWLGRLRESSLTGHRRLALAASVFFALFTAGVLYLARPAVGPEADPALDEVEISEMKIRGTEVFQAPRSLLATAIEVVEGSDVIFRAGEVVALGNGFAVSSEASFTVDTGGSTPPEEPIRQ